MYLRLFGQLILLLIFSMPALAGPIQIDISQTAQRDSITDLAAGYLKKLIIERSGGRVQVRLLQDQNVIVAETLKKLSQQDYQLALIELSALKQQFPSLKVFEYPFLFQDRESLYQAFELGVKTQFFSDFKSTDFKLLSFWDTGFHQLAGMIPLLQPEDLTELSLEPAAGQLEKSLPQFQMQRNSEKNLESDNRIGYDLTLAKLLPLPNGSAEHLTLTNHLATGYLLVANRTFWNRLPEDLKVIVSGTLKDASGYARELSQQQEANQLNRLTATHNMTISHLTPAQRQQWRNATRQNYAKSATDRDKNFIELLLDRETTD